MIISCMIKKNPNLFGNFDCQYIEDGKMKICCFKTYEDGVCYAYFNWGLTKEKHYQNSVVLEKE